MISGDKVRNIIITGGELFNKGAQAMVFITVNELKKRYPEHRTYLLSEMDLRRSKAERDIYTFDFTGWYPIKFAKAQNNFFIKQMCKLRNAHEYNEAYELYSNCDLMIDISGYALGSNWSYETCTLYLDHLEFAKAFGIPMYIMPQSFGPFDFNENYACELNNRIQRLLASAKVVCAREQEGFNGLIDHYHLSNVVQKVDLVLNSKGFDISSIYKKPPVLEEYFFTDKTVGIIPNSMTETVCEKGQIKNLYEAIIQLLIHEGYYVYLVAHAESDFDLCRDIKKIFDSDRVVMIDKDLSCIEFSNLVSKFEFIIASRFHSIVHSFKNNVPCIALGWAQKYQELMSLFHQEAYAFDFRKEFSIDCLVEQVKKLEKNLSSEKETLLATLQELQSKNVFDILPVNL